jgi:hypothetical protein
MLTIGPQEPLGIAVAQAIRTGDLDALNRLLADNPALVTARINERPLLHVATDWPGHFPNVASVIKIQLWHAAALGIMPLVEAFFAGNPPPSPVEVSNAFWQACHGGQRQAAEFLLARGADLNWVPTWAKQTPLDMAESYGATDLVEWLRAQGARSSKG